ncbi:MAG: hypothetical protein JWR05_3507 [Mucilaginibacter sp.]|nr:hypothetical protein [Mucilaginibacter sp.]
MKNIKRTTWIAVAVITILLWSTLIFLRGYFLRSYSKKQPLNGVMHHSDYVWGEIK